LRDKAAGQANPKALAERCRRLLAWWGGKSLAEVTPWNCRAYAASRKGAGGARRDLEDLRAAVRHHAKEDLHRGEVNVVLPDKGPPRERWLTRSEAAQLLWACWRAREKQKRSRKGPAGEAIATRRHTLRHLARFILVGLYTGTRAGAIASASWAAASGRSYVDVERGVFYRLAQGAKATRKRQPPVPIPARLLAHIRRWQELGVSKEYLVEYHGLPVKSVKTGFASAVKLAGLDGRITPHTLRHTAATWLMQAGVPMWESAGFLGMSPDMLERTYGHHHPDHMRGAAQALNVGANKTPRAARGARHAASS